MGQTMSVSFSSTASGTSGIAVTLTAQAVKLVIQFVSLIVLSRLLTPEDFGLVAIVTVFLALGDLLRDFGMSTIGLQRLDLNQQQASNLFWVNSALGLFSAILLTLSTPLIVLVFSEPRLWGIVPALSPLLLFGGIAAQFRVQLARTMKFVSLNAVEVFSKLAILGIAVFLALQGFQYWAIVISNLAGSLILLLGFWHSSKWMPSTPKRGFKSRELVADGASFGLAYFLQFLASFGDTLVIGLRWGAISVGIYDRGFQFYALPGNTAFSPLTTVVIPTVNRAVSQGRDMDEVLLRVQFGLSFVAVWFFAAFGATAGWWVPELLGNNWSETAIIFQILAIAGMVSVFSHVNYWRIVLGNLGSELVKYNLVTKLMTVMLIVVTSFFGLFVLAWGVTAGLVLSWPVALLWFSRVAAWPSKTYFIEGFRVIFPGIIAYAVGYYSYQALQSTTPFIPLFVLFTVSILYVFGILLFPGGLAHMRVLFRSAGKFLRLRTRHDGQS